MSVMKMTQHQVKAPSEGHTQEKTLEEGLAIGGRQPGTEEVSEFAKMKMIMLIQRPFFDLHLVEIDSIIGHSLMKRILNGGARQESDLSSHRLALGLSVSGPLKLEEVKNAYRACALKWHPDRHLGSSKAVAEEKFKLCSAAYQSLCDKLAVE
uniref:J domain-containing protein n=1 Tax=Cannabis sativa TaxID=3483 RepID=A0A803QP12_CANSA